MFLYERIFGIGTYMFVLIFICLFLTKTNVSCKVITRFYLICLCIMAFFYKPYVTADLYRIYEQMRYFAALEFKQFWMTFAIDSSFPISRLLFWVFGKTGINELLPTFSAFACYSCLFYIVNKTKERYNISRKSVAIVLFYIMTTSMYISVIGGIRMMLALSIIAFSYYRATIEKRITIIDIVIYIVSIYIHAMSIVVIVVCVLVSLFDASKKGLKKVGYILVAGIVGAIFVTQSSSTLNKTYQKFLEFVLGDKHSDTWEYIMGVFIILILFLMFVEFRRICRAEDYRQIKKMNLVSILSVLIAVCFCFEFSIFYRFGTHVAVLFSIPSMMVSLEKTRGRASVFLAKIDYRSIVILLSLIVAAISCTRGSLSSLKFFVI